MVRLTRTEIEELEINYEAMLKCHNELTVERVDQEILDGIISTLRIVCENAYSKQGLSCPVFSDMDISDLDNNKLYSMIAELNKSTRDLLVIARSVRQYEK